MVKTVVLAHDDSENTTNLKLICNLNNILESLSL